MTLTFISPEWANKTIELWKKHKAPCYLRTTDDPCVCSVSVRPGVSSIVAQIFIVHACMNPNCHRKLERELLRTYTSEEKKQILKEVAKYDLIIEEARLL